MYIGSRAILDSMCGVMLNSVSGIVDVKIVFVFVNGAGARCGVEKALSLSIALSLALF